VNDHGNNDSKPYVFGKRKTENINKSEELNIFLRQEIENAEIKGTVIQRQAVTGPGLRLRIILCLIWFICLPPFSGYGFWCYCSQQHSFTYNILKMTLCQQNF